MVGYIYVGLFQTTGTTVTPPTFAQLKAGIDGSGNPSISPASFNPYVSANIPYTFLFSSLTANTSYAFSFTAKNDDPSTAALNTQVYSISATKSLAANTNNTTTPKFSGYAQTFLLGLFALLICFIL